MGGNVAETEDKVNSRTSYFPLGSGLLVNGVHLTGLSSFAVAHQYFEPLADGGDFFIERGAGGGDVVIFALILLLLPPAACLVLEALAGVAGRGLRTAIHLCFIGALLGLVCWQALTDDGDTSRLPQLIALVVGAAGAFAYARIALVRSWLTALGVAPIVVLALFLIFSPLRALVFGGAGEDPRPLSSNGAPVVMVVLDELPVTSLMDSSGRVAARHFPAFAHLQRQSTWYRNAASVADFTQLAVPSLLTGSRAERDTLQVAAEHPRNVFTLLGGSYRLNVWEFNTDLCPERFCRRLGQPGTVRRQRRLVGDATAAVPALPEGVRKRVADALDPGPDPPPEVAAPTGKSVRVHLRAGQGTRFERFLTSLRPSRGRTLDFLHLLLPHRPWVYLPSGQRYPAGRPYADSLFARLPDDRRAVAIALQRHLLQVQAVDRMLGRLFARLRRLRLWDRALIVVTADHGASFRPGDLPRVVTDTNVGEVAPVPLLVKEPRQRAARVDDSPVESTDLLPILARALRTRLPWEVEGRLPGARRTAITVRRQRGGGEVRISRARLARQRDRALRRNLALLGPGGDPLAIGPAPGLIGRRPARLRPLEMELDRSYRSVDPRAPSLAADVSGVVRKRGTRPRRIAVALNGRIAATAWTLVRREREYFTVLVPPSAFVRGANRVEVFALD